MNPPAPPVVNTPRPPAVPRVGAAPTVPPAPPVVRPAAPRTAAPTPAATASVVIPSVSHTPAGGTHGTLIDSGDKHTRDSDARTPLPPGTVLGSYTIISRMGRGGYGITYRARHTAKGNAVVIKEHMPIGMAIREPGSTEVIFPSAQAEERFHSTMAEFLEEITVLRALQYPGIVPIIDSFEANETAYYVMPFIAGITLRPSDKATLDAHRQRLMAQRTKRTLHSLLCTLEYMELHHIVHRDIKTDNILITTEGLPVLLDFGSARQLQAGKVFSNVFTPDFCAPEQSNAESDEEMSRALGPWTDLYALGATFYYLITRIVPPAAEIRACTTPDPYNPLARRPELVEIYGSEFLESIDRAMEMNPADRWSSAVEWRESIENESSGISPKLLRNIRIFGSLAAIAFIVVGSLAIYAFSERNHVRAAFDSGLTFTESMLYDFSTELTDIPGSTNLQRHLSANLQKYLTTMRDLPVGEDARLDRAMAAAWFNIGCMHMSLGNLSGARDALHRAEELELMISRKNPEDQNYRYELARTRLALAELANRNSLSAESAAHAEKAVSILQELHASYPLNPNYGSSLGEAWAFETFHLRKEGNHEARKEVLDKLLSLYRDLVAQFPRHLGSACGLGAALHYCGRYAKDMGDYASAEKHLAESHTIFTRLTTSYPYRLSFKKGLSELMYTMGEMYYYQCLLSADKSESNNLSHRASQALREHIDLVRQLRELDNNNLSYLLMECRALELVSNLLILHGEVNEAEAYMRTVLSNVDFLLTKEPHNSDYIATKASALCCLARAHYCMPRHITKATGELESARRLLDEQIARFKSPAEILLSTRVEVWVHSASIALGLGDVPQGLIWLDQAERQLGELLRGDSPTPRQKVYLSHISHLKSFAHASGETNESAK